MRDLIPKKEILGLLAEQQQLMNPMERNLAELASLCSKFGKYLKLSPNNISILEAGAYLHDVGNLLIDSSILRQSGKLNCAEWELVRQHPSLGKRLLGEFASFQPVLEIVEMHHERIDGNGYPSGLEGDEIPFLVQVFSVCDTWHSMRSDRNHRKALPLEESINLLKQEAEFGLFDESLVSEFLSFIDNQLIFQPPGITGTVEVSEAT